MEKLQTRGLRPKPTYDLGSPWADYRIASSGLLAGRTVGITLDDGRSQQYSFGDATVKVSWSGEDVASDASYDAVEERAGIFFVQIPAQDLSSTTSLVLDFNGHAGVLVTNSVLEVDGKPELEQVISPFVFDNSDGTFPDMSTELVGKRAYAEYADGHTAEHIYVNPRRFAWQGLGKFDYSGSEMDDSTTWKIADALYVLTWVEEWQAVGAVLLMDFAEMRNVGVLFGRDDNGTVHTLCGARLSKLGEISYPAGYEPPGVHGASQLG
jgi:MoaF C-terminal domain/MoaF N-terminal domain